MFISSGYSAQTRRSSSATKDHHVAAGVVVGLCDRSPWQRLEPDRAAARLQLVGAEPRQGDDVAADRALAARGHELAHALDLEPAGATAHRNRLARPDPAVALMDV